MGTIAPENWITQDGEFWLNSIDVASAPDVGILSFPNRLGTEGVLSWRDVEEQGAAFLFELQRLADDNTVCSQTGLLFVPLTDEAVVLPHCVICPQLRWLDHKESG